MRGGVAPGAPAEVVVRQPVRLLIFATDADRARAFYAHVFGWALPDHGPRRGWVITTGDDPRLGTDGSPDPDLAGNRFIPTVHVTDLEATTAAVRAAGGEVLVSPIPVPGVGWLVYLADTEDNVLGVMQDDPRAT